MTDINWYVIMSGRCVIQTSVNDQYTVKTYISLYHTVLQSDRWVIKVR